LLIIFINRPTWRVISITTIAMMIVVLLIDGTTHARIEAYNTQLQLLNKKTSINYTKEN